MPSARTLAFLCAVGVGLICPGMASVRAQTTYEDVRVDEALDSLHVTRDPTPEGKRIAYVRVIRRDVFAEGELVFDWVVWLNTFHWLTEAEVVAREARFARGEPFRDVAARETERNLRSLGIFSLVRVIAVREREPGTVGVIVFTRDLWSLRLETDFEGSGDSLRALGQLTERNLFGRNKTAILRAERRFDSFSVGQAYSDYRAFDGRLRLIESGDLIFNNATGAIEGGLGRVSLDRPFYNLDQRFGYELSGAFVQQINRKPSQSGVAYVDLTGESDRCNPASPDCVPAVYLDRNVSVQLGGHYRAGKAYKQTWSGGLFLTDQHVRPVAETGLVPGQEDDFAALVLPKARTQVGPFLRYRLFTPRYEQFKNLGSYGRTETVTVGPMLDARMLFPLLALGSTANAYRVSGQADYAWAAHDALVWGRLFGSARLELGRVVDQLLVVQLRAASPAKLAGRLVWQGRLEGRRNDTANTFVALGNQSGLRGYPAGNFYVLGGGMILSNLEYRTLPLDLWSVQVGLVAFYDAGGVFRTLPQVEVRHAVGLGLRVVVPQFNRLPFRLDFGVPLDGQPFVVRVSFGGQQVISLTPEEELQATQDLRSVSGN